jgi:molybdenum cofactor synthesis domain-containing protein
LNENSSSSLETGDHEHLHYHGVDRAEKHLDVEHALALLLSGIKPVGSERIKASQALGRVLSEDLCSAINVPQLPRSTRDGFALAFHKSIMIEKKNLEGATFRIIGEIRIGTLPKFSVKPGEAVQVATGSSVPTGTDAVVMKEYVTTTDGLVTPSPIPRAGENILAIGADITKGSVILRRGSRVQAHHLALITQTGVRFLKVFRRPVISFFSTGDELFDSTKDRDENSGNRRESRAKLSAAKIPDITGPFIRASISNLGAVPRDLGIARDNLDEIRRKMKQGLRSDALVLSAGSSVGERDYVTNAVESIKGVRILVHGVAMRPSSPTALATYGGRPVILLPGFPTSAIVSFLVFAKPAFKHLSGEEPDNISERFQAVLPITSG